jgi:hypothetical protein
MMRKVPPSFNVTSPELLTITDCEAAHETVEPSELYRICVPAVVVAVENLIFAPFGTVLPDGRSVVGFAIRNVYVAALGLELA